MGSVSCTWDANGNLLDDGTNAYTYDSANRLTAVSGGENAVSYTYNGLGNRLQQTVNSNTITYVNDLNSGLTQVLSDGTNTYLYGNDRLAQINNMETDYFLGDALGSVRQMVDESGAIIYAAAYDPYGNVLSTNGDAQTSYGYANEYTSQGLVNLRSRLYDPSTGRFLTQDSWQGDYNNPLSLNQWNYVEGNPVNKEDPAGHCVGPNGVDLPDGSLACNNGNGGTSNTVGNKVCDGSNLSESCKIVTTGDLKNVLSSEYNWNLLGDWNFQELTGIFDAGFKIKYFVDNLTHGDGLVWMQHYLGGTNISHVNANTPSYVPRQRDSTMPAIISGTGANTVYLTDNWLLQDGGSPWLAHEMGHIWDINTSILITNGGFVGGVGDQLNKATGGNIIGCLFADRYQDGSGTNQIKDPFKGGSSNYGNNSTADYLAESFRLLVYPGSTPGDLVPAEAQAWVQREILDETIRLIFPPGSQWSR